MKGKSAIKKNLFLLVFCCIAATGTAANIGDVNGDGNVTIVDALMTAQYYVGLSPNPFNVSVSDVNCDGVPTIVDALMIAQYYVGLVTSFAACGQATVTPTPQGTATPVSQGSIYVSPSGNDANAGTQSSPLFSLASAAQRAVPGTVIYMAGGTYNYMATVSLAAAGTASQPIKIEPMAGGRPVLSWANWSPASEEARGMARGIKVEQTARYWEIRGIEISYAPDNGVKCEGAHIVFDRVVFHHNGDSGIQIGLNKDDYDANPDPENLAAYCSVVNCDSYRNADPATGYENADGFACKLYAGTGNSFYGCRAWENADDGWDCYQTNYLITIENCWTWHNGDPALFGNPSSFAGDGNGFKLGGDDAPCPIIVKRCVAFDLNFGALSGFSDNNNGQAVTIYNCLAWLCGRSFNMNQQPHVIRNCADFDSVRQAPKDFDSGIVAEGNSWNLGIAVTAADFVSVSVNDAIASRQADGSLPNNGFARLKAGSQLIDKGMNVGMPYNGSAPDIGAYEY